MGVIYRKISNLLMHRLKEHDITPEQWAVLYRVSEREGMIQKEIAERAGKDRPTTTRILDALEAKGFVVKQAGEQDRRSFLVFSTEKGRALIEQIVPIEKQTIADATDGISTADVELLHRLLRQIGENIDRLT
ncbi:MarR family transcriptional regulator [Brevibacillus fluminis]|uniref:MarR family transcriptional regulator n=2 Tax=Brevibacillus fluminis TaxID=511487 RepID=A0A3M8DTM5_9BACL|nr:MarR family transcriptional regulator [Brevibacillus fluminis]RNB90711.1 MarR family transcriptional regulator [Brevibacillus fluminis]